MILDAYHLPSRRSYIVDPYSSNTSTISSQVDLMSACYRTDPETQMSASHEMVSNQRVRYDLQTQITVCRGTACGPWAVFLIKFDV